jgi:hypothetical protein
MPGFSPQVVANSARNANTVQVAIGQNIIAFAQTVGHQLPFGSEQLYGIGSSKPQEVQQLRMSPQISIDAFALTDVGENLLADNQNLSYLLAGNQFTIFVMDGLNNNAALYTYVGCKAQNFSESIPTNAPIRDTFTFLALDVLDPNGNSLMNTGENALAVAAAGVQAAGAALGLSA